MMMVKERDRREIEMRLMKMGDYVKIDYLRSCLKVPLDFDTRKFVLVKLAGIYEMKKMFSEAGKIMRLAADINTTVQSKITDFVKSAELFIKGARYDEADICARRAIAIANEKQKNEINKSVKEFYKAQATGYINRGKRLNALNAYEKIMTLELDATEKDEVHNKLINLYRDLGRVREYNSMRSRMR